MRTGATVVPTIRQPQLDYREVPQAWVAGDAALTGLLNGLCVLFPEGERGFIRNVMAFRDAWERDPELAARIRGFIGQEARHARAHRAFVEVLEGQGYVLGPMMARMSAGAASMAKRLPPVLDLACTAGVEHLTAVMSEALLSGEIDLLERMHPEMAKLLAWHAVEEIEHRAVAFDLLRAIDDRHGLRMAGFALALVLVLSGWRATSRFFWTAEGLSPRRAWGRLPKRGRFLRRVVLPGLSAYVRRDFHPDGKPTGPWLEMWRARIEAWTTIRR